MKKFGNVLWGIILIIIGLIIGGNALGITNINIFFDGWWTLFIIIPCFIGGKVSSEIKKLNEKRNGENSYCATFSGQNVNFDGEKFTGADLTAIFGGVKCDLRKAIIESDVVINASSTFGGIDIYVPSNVKIKTKSTSIFGGVENKANTTEDENSHTIYINGTALFGGVEVK